MAALSRGEEDAIVKALMKGGGMDEATQVHGEAKVAKVEV